MELKDIFYIDKKDWYKLQAWASLDYEEDKNEISGLMTAVPQEDGRIKIGDVEILKQENSSTNTELDGDAVTEYTMKYAMKYNNPDMKFVWWHSHHTMGAFWSGTDEKEIDAWKNSSFSLALVVNLKEEYKFRVSFWRMNGLPIEQHVDTTLTIERPEPKIHITDSMKKEYKELCSERASYVQTWNTKWKHNTQQLNVWKNHNLVEKNETAIVSEARYGGLLEDVADLQESFLDGTVKIKQIRNELIKINKECKESKFPFKINEKFIKYKKTALHNKLMEIMPGDMFEWEDNKTKNEYESIAWSSGFGQGGYW